MKMIVIMSTFQDQQSGMGFFFFRRGLGFNCGTTLDRSWILFFSGNVLESSFFLIIFNLFLLKEVTSSFCELSGHR